MPEVLIQKRDQGAEAIRFRAQGVTGADSIDVSFQASTPVDTVASSIAEMLGMPDDVPYALRDNASSVYLEDRPIGDQIEAGTHVTVTPKSHLA